MDNLISTMGLTENSKAENTISHTHVDYQLIYVFNGSLSISIDTVNYEVTADSVILLNPSVPHKVIKSSDDYSRFTLTLNSALCEKVFDKNLVYIMKFSPRNRTSVIKIEKEDSKSLKNYFTELYISLSEDAPLKDLYSKALLNLILISVFRKAVKNNYTLPSKTVLSIQNYIEKHFSDDLSLEILAKEHFVSISHLCHIFKSEAGYSIKKYIDLIRLKEAENLLINTDHSVKKICILCGYGDINNFIRKFKSKYHITPLCYRKYYDKVH